MTDKETELEKIMEDFDDDGDGESSSDSQFKNELDRLERLQQEGKITNEEYEILQSHSAELNETSSSSSTESIKFGKPIVTSEGSDMDFSIIGVIEDVDTTNLTHEYGDDGGPGRILVFWQIYNHSGEEIKLKHKHLEHIGEDRIAYNRDANPLHVDSFSPG